MALVVVDAGVGDDDVDLVQAADDIARRTAELRAVDQQDDLLGALDEADALLSYAQALERQRRGLFGEDPPR